MKTQIQKDATAFKNGRMPILHGTGTYYHETLKAFPLFPKTILISLGYQ